ncbi:cation diffusion facilitator family transporter [Chloroflexota bacterium]
MLSTKSGAARFSLVVIIGLIMLKVVVTVITGSISILAQAVDSFLDLFAIVITLFAVGVASVPADEQHPFGHGKAEGIAAIVQGVLVAITSGLIIYSAVQRIIADARVELTEAGMGVMLVSIIVSILLSRHLVKVSQNTGSIALESLSRNITADIYSAVGVLAGLALVRFARIGIIDSIVAIGVALFIMREAYVIFRRSLGELLDRRLTKSEEDEITTCIIDYTGQIVGFHGMRTRRAGSQRYIDLHLLMPKGASVEEAHNTCDHLEEAIESRLPNSSVTIHVEPCRIKCEQCFIQSCSLRWRRT